MSQAVYPASTFQIYHIDRSRGLSLRFPSFQCVYQPTLGQWQQKNPEYAAFHIFDTVTYKNNSNAEAASQNTGKRVTTKLAAIGVPFLISNVVHRYIKLGLQHIKIPLWPAKHARLLSIIFSSGLFIFLIKPVKDVIGLLLDRDYRSWRPWTILKHQKETQSENIKRLLTVS